MAARQKKGQRLEDELAAVCDLPVRGLERALRERSAPVAALAAVTAREKSLNELVPALVFAFERFRADGVKNDPTCRAKEAAIESLDRLDANVPDTFIAATRYFQHEPAWGAPVDTAVNIRARAILALARWGDRDTALLAGKLLVDPEWPARQAAADALGVYGERNAAAALLVVMAHEKEPEVITSCMQSLLRLAPELALPELKNALAGSGEARDCALLALAQSGRDDALTVLLAHLDGDPAREDAIRALGLHRSDRALEALLAFITDGAPAVAEVATAALGARRFDPGVRKRALAAVRKNDTRAVLALFEETFRDVR